MSDGFIKVRTVGRHLCLAEEREWLDKVEEVLNDFFSKPNVKQALDKLLRDRMAQLALYGIEPQPPTQEEVEALWNEGQK